MDTASGSSEIVPRAAQEGFSNPARDYSCDFTRRTRAISLGSCDRLLQFFVVIPNPWSR